MKKHIYTIVGLFTLLIFTQCSEPENPIYEVLDTYTSGAVLRTVEISSAEFNSFDSSTFFEVTIEEQDEQNGSLMQEVKVYLGFDDNTSANKVTTKAETLYTTLPASSFVAGEFGLPRTTIKITLEQALNTLKLTSDEFLGGDAIDIRLELILNDGRTFSSMDATGSLQGSFFSSPYTYKSVIKCIPPGAVPGIYTFKLTDSYGDGWQGSHIKVTVDGNVTNYGIPSPYASDGPRNEILEPYTGNNSAGEVTLTIPETAKEMSFEWISGDWPSECGFSITFQNLDGSALQTAYSESNPAKGEKILSICN